VLYVGLKSWLLHRRKVASGGDFHLQLTVAPQLIEFPDPGLHDANFVDGLIVNLMVLWYGTSVGLLTVAADWNHAIVIDALPVVAAVKLSVVAVLPTGYVKPVAPQPSNCVPEALVNEQEIVSPT